MILVAEGELRRGRRNKTMSILDIVASSCAELFDGKGAAELSDAFSDLLADAVAEVRRRSAGSLVVQADEPGATVFLNGVSLGPAPLIIRNLPPAKHLLAVVKAGHKPFGKVVKVGSDEVRVQARLTKPLGEERPGVFSRRCATTESARTPFRWRRSCSESTAGNLPWRCSVASPRWTR